MEQNLFRVFHAFRAQATFPRGEIYVGLALRDNFSGEEDVEQAAHIPAKILLQSKTLPPPRSFSPEEEKVNFGAKRHLFSLSLVFEFALRHSRNGKSPTKIQCSRRVKEGGERSKKNGFLTGFQVVCRVGPASCDKFN